MTGLSECVAMTGGVVGGWKLLCEALRGYESTGGVTARREMDCFVR